MSPDEERSAKLANIDAAQLHQQILQSDHNQTMEDELIEEDLDSSHLNEDYPNADFVEGYVNVDKLNSDLQQAMQLESIRDFIRFCVSQMRAYDVVVAQGSSDVFAEAAAIVLHTLNLEWSADEQILDCRLTNQEKSEVLELLRQRIIKRQPLSYMINLAYFCDMPFYVDERVLIPRSPIAELIRQQFNPYFKVNQIAKPLLSINNDSSKATQLAQVTHHVGLVQSQAGFFEHGLENKALPQPEQILDLCTGSGCIAVALASRFPEARIDATDIDQSALEIAWVNVEHHALDYQINLIESDLFAKLPADQQYDLIVTNPPYVDAAAMADLPPEFLYEPEHALAAGQDGLDLVHKILLEAPNYLAKNGLLVCEVGDSEWALRQAYPHIEFNWLHFAFGGSGVFAIDRATLQQFNSSFAKYVANLDELA